MLRLFSGLKKHKVAISLTLILVFLQAMAELFLPKLMSLIVDEGIVNNDINYILKNGIIMILIALAATVCTIVVSFLSAKISTSFSASLRKKVFKRIESYSLNEFDKIGTSSLITRNTNDIMQVQQLLILMLRMMLTAPMMAIGGIIIAVSTNRQLSLSLFIIIPIIIVFFWIIIKKAIPLFKSIQIKVDNINRVFRERLAGIRVIRAFNRIKYENKRFNKANQDLTDVGIKVSRIAAIIMPMMMLIFNIAAIAIIRYGNKQVNERKMQNG